MGTFGKILLAINLLASAGFVYLATQDWAKGRQVIEAAGLRQVVLLQGLPLGDAKAPAGTGDDEIPFPVEMAGGVPVRTVSPGWLKTYFQASGAATAEPGGLVLTTNAPVASQLDELRRVKGVIETAVNAADGPASRAAIVAPLLLLQPETLDERLQVLAQQRDGDKLWDRLRAKFDQVQNPPAGGGAEGDEAAEARGDRRAKLAHLLVHLSQDPGWQKRVMMVVGVRQYVAAVGAQANRFREMAARVERLTADDQDRFAAEYAQLRGLAIQRTQTVRDTAEVRARLEDQLKKDQDFVAQRQTQLRELAVQLARVKAEVDGLLARQKVTEDALLAVQLEVALTEEEVYRLSERLAQVERERYGAAGK